jgi:hypothetical protein
VEVTSGDEVWRVRGGVAKLSSSEEVQSEEVQSEEVQSEEAQSEEAQSI